jgi:hypothetical protein
MIVDEEAFWRCYQIALEALIPLRPKVIEGVPKAKDWTQPYRTCALAARYAAASIVSGKKELAFLTTKQEPGEDQVQ